jgi:DNA-directed RNA polymerase specialized sigma24 family protein
MEMTPGDSWSMTQEAFDRLLARLDPDRDRAALEYERIRHKLIYFFERHGSAYSAEQTDETINRVARKAAEGEEIRAEDVSRYFYGVARFVLKEHWRDPKREWSSLDALPEEPSLDPRAIESRLEEAADEERLQSCLRQCLARISAPNRELIHQYYQGTSGDRIRRRKELANTLRLPLNALRIRAHRIRMELEACIEACVG